MEPPVSQCFAGLRFFVSRRFEERHAALLHRGGAARVSATLRDLTDRDGIGEPRFDFAVVDDNEGYDAVGSGTAATKRRVRAMQVPVVTTEWVRFSLERGARIAMEDCSGANARLIRYNPQLFAGLVFTASGLPGHVKRNVSDVVTFFGGAYSRDLLSTTDIVIAEPGCASNKVYLARKRNLRVVPLQWLQKSAEDGLMPVQHKAITDLAVDLTLSWAEEAKTVFRAGAATRPSDEANDIEGLETAGCIRDGDQIDAGSESGLLPSKKHRSEPRPTSESVVSNYAIPPLSSPSHPNASPSMSSRVRSVEKRLCDHHHGCVFRMHGRLARLRLLAEPEEETGLPQKMYVLLRYGR